MFEYHFISCFAYCWYVNSSNNNNKTMLSQHNVLEVLLLFCAYNKERRDFDVRERWRGTVAIWTQCMHQLNLHQEKQSGWQWMLTKTSISQWRAQLQSLHASVVLSSCVVLNCKVLRAWSKVEIFNICFPMVGGWPHNYLVYMFFIDIHQCFKLGL